MGISLFSHFFLLRWESLSCSPVWGRKWGLLFLWIMIFFFSFSASLAWVLPALAKSCFLLFQGNIPGPKGVSFVQLVGMSQCTETDPGGLAAQLPKHTARTLSNFRVPSEDHPTPKDGQSTSQKILSLFGVNFMPESPPKPFLKFLIMHPRTVGLDSPLPIPLSLCFYNTSRAPLAL